MLAAAKAGFKVVDIDLSIKTVAETRQVLSQAPVKILYFKAEHGDTNYLTLLRKSIPEFFHYNDAGGQLFHSKYFPTLRYFVHMGLENEVGALNFSELLTPDSDLHLLEEASETANDNTPLYSQVTKTAEGGIKLSQVHSQAQALALPAWSFAKKLGEGTYYEVDNRL